VNLTPPIVESRRDVPYGTINLQKFAHFYVLSAQTLDIFFFLRILYLIPYHGPKKDIISYHISRPKKGYRIYILYPFQFENEPNMAWIGIKHRKVVISMFILEICYCLQMPMQCSVCVQCSVLSKRELPTTSVNKNYIVQKKKKRGKVQICTEKRI
jgi:hypothetical protein